MNLVELAAKLNLSISTVSRALSRPEMVAPHTRERIAEAAERYGYRPNGIARSLRKGKTQTIGLIVSDIQNPFYAAVTRAAERVAARQGYTLIICNADENAENEMRALRLLDEMQVAGIIHGSTGATLPTLEALSAKGIPIVDIDRVSGLAEADTVLVDNARGAALAAEHLLSLGHRHVAVITGPQHLTTGTERLTGFRQALGAAGITLEETYVKIGDFREASGHQATLELLDLPAPPTALFVANNEMMAGALAALQTRVVRVPEDISLISFDDVRWAKYVDPPLTIVAQPTERIGTLAAELLFERLAGRRQKVIHRLEPTLVVRMSCASPKER